MHISQIKKDLLSILDVNPDWIATLDINPIANIIKKSKTHELLFLLRKVFGFIDGNPLIKKINKEHYSQDKIQIIFRKIVRIEKDLRERDNVSDQLITNTISLLSEIEYFKIFPNRYSDTFIKTVIKSNFIKEVDNIGYKSKTISLLGKMGYSNIYVDRELKKLENCQNKDGGWGETEGLKSDVFISLLVFECFRQNRLWKKRDFILKLEDYLISNHLSASQSKNEQDRWNRIHSGYKENGMLEGGSLLLLEGLLMNPSELNEKKIKSLIKWLKSIQLDSGYFPYHAELKSQDNLMTTIKSTFCFKKYYLLKSGL